MKNDQSLIRSLPQLPALDDSTKALFDAIKNRDLEGVNRALGLGARVDQVQPFYEPPSSGSDIEGGLLPLQAACSVPPQRLINTGIIEALLSHGADANATGIEDETGLPLAIVASRLPQNGPQSIDVLGNYGARADIGLITRAIEAHKSWSDPAATVRYLEANLDALWQMMPLTEQAKLTIDLLMKVVPDSAVALNYQQIKSVQWLSNHCTVQPAHDLRERLQERRASTLSSSMTAPSSKLH